MHAFWRAEEGWGLGKASRRRGRVTRACGQCPPARPQRPFPPIDFRWINCLLLREVPPPAAARLFDTWAAEGRGGGSHGAALADLLVHACAAFLLTWRDQLVGMEFQARERRRRVEGGLGKVGGVGARPGAPPAIHALPLPLCPKFTPQPPEATAKATPETRPHTSLTPPSRRPRQQNNACCRTWSCFCSAPPRRPGPPPTSTPCWPAHFSCEQPMGAQAGAAAARGGREGGRWEETAAAALRWA